MNLKKIKNFEDLKKMKAEFYSNNGELKKLQIKIKNANNNQKKELGKKITKLKKNAEIFFNKAKTMLEQKRINEKINNEWVDISYPLEKMASLHPLTLIENRFRDWLINNGYFETTGSEIETEEYNFEKLNISQDHPARDLQATLYISSSTLLRTHNTGFSAKELEKNKNESFAHFTIGPVYRNDEDDALHSHQFTQVDIIAVGNINFPNLIYTLKNMIQYVLDKDVKFRVRPSYFPFTEPSIEMDIYYNRKWVEILGGGMLHPNVMKNAGYNNNMIALAIGVGIERIAMIKYGINDIREFYKNDLKFISQFRGGN